MTYEASAERLAAQLQQGSKTTGMLRKVADQPLPEPISKPDPQEQADLDAMESAAVMGSPSTPELEGEDDLAVKREQDDERGVYERAADTLSETLAEQASQKAQLIDRTLPEKQAAFERDVARVAKDMGLEPDYVARNFQRVNALNERRNQRLESRGAPVLEGYLDDPQTYVELSDDTQSLGAIEKTLKETSGRFTTDALNVDLANIRWAQMMAGTEDVYADALADVDKRIKENQAGLPSAGGSMPWYQEAVPIVAESLPMIWESIKGGADEGLMGAGGGAHCQPSCHR